MTQMSKIDFQICRDVMTALTSKKIKKNYLFLEPVNLLEFPTYITLVKRPMDLGTVTNNLNDDFYSTREACFADAALCFENAETFNRDDPGRTWIVKYAQDMKRVMNKEKKRAEKNRLGGGSGSSGGTSLKLKLGKSGKKRARDKSPSPHRDSVDGGGNSGNQKSSGKIKLSIKTQTSSSTSSSSAVDNNINRNGKRSSESSSKERKKRRKNPKNSPTYSSSASVSSQSTTPTPAPKMKITFKLNKKEVSDNSSTAITSNSSTAITSNSSNQSKGGGGGKHTNTPVVKARHKLKFKAPSHRKQSESNSGDAPAPTTNGSNSSDISRTIPKTSTHSRSKDLSSTATPGKTKKNSVKGSTSSSGKGASVKGSTSGKGPTSKGFTSKGSSGKGSTSKGSSGKGSASKSSTSKSSTSKSSTSKSSTSKSSTSKISTSKISIPKISIPKISIPKISIPKTSTSKGSTPKGSTPKGSKSKGSKSKGSTCDSVPTSPSQSPKRQQPVIIPLSRGKELPKTISASSMSSDKNNNNNSDNDNNDKPLPKKAPIPKKITSEPTIPKKNTTSDQHQQLPKKMHLNLSSKSKLSAPNQQQRTTGSDSGTTTIPKGKTPSAQPKKIHLNIPSRPKSSVSSPDQLKRSTADDSSATTISKDKTLSSQPKKIRLSASKSSASNQQQQANGSDSSVTTTSKDKTSKDKTSSSQPKKLKLSLSSRPKSSTSTPDQKERTTLDDSSATTTSSDETSSQPKKIHLKSSRRKPSDSTSDDSSAGSTSDDSSVTKSSNDKTSSQPKKINISLSSRPKSSSSSPDHHQRTTVKHSSASATATSNDETPPQPKKIHLNVSTKRKPSDSSPDLQQHTSVGSNEATTKLRDKTPSSETITTKITAIATPSTTAKTIATPTATVPTTTVQQKLVVVLSPAVKAQCAKVLSALKQRGKDVGWFLKPVTNDPKLKEDYRAKIPIPMDLGTMSSKLEKNQYPTVSEFVNDIRRIFANCLRFNDNADNLLRPIASDMLSSSENAMNLFLSQQQGVAVVSPPYPKLLYCWKRCMLVLNELLKLKNPDDGFPTAHYFMHPVSHFWGGVFREDYTEKVKQPMDLGTVTAKLCEGVYQTVEAFIADCRLVPANCEAYYSKRDDGPQFMAQAARLNQFMSTQLENLFDYDRSNDGTEAKKIAMDSSQSPLLKVPKAFFTSMLQELRGSTYTDKFTKISEPATRQFEEPVDVTMFADYLQRIETPMDMKTIEKKIDQDAYQTAEDFEYDITLIFKNCDSYNTNKRTHIVQRSKFCAKVFKKMYASRIKAFDASGGKKIFGEDKKDKKRPDGPTISIDDAPPTKKVKIETTVPKSIIVKAPKVVTKTVRVAMEDKPVPTVPVPRSKSPRPDKVKKGTPRTVSKPAPVQDAIDQIRKEYTLRDHKELDSWEGACSRFLQALKRHAWIAATRPKFIFTVPVPILFPQIKDEYAEKIKHPMDLTTAECKLLQGGIYNHADEFVADVAFVFANAVTFNQAGREEGSPLSCAYFDASRHLLRYARWLSLEHLSPYLTDNSLSEGPKQIGPLPEWKLTTSNRKDALEEMESMVMNCPIDNGDDGDRYKWMLAECEKLLKSLRHQSDLKHMTYFIETKYPADYLSYISKPMDWASCEKRLFQCKYDTFGEIVEDLRLIFANALKYNARHKEIDSESGRVSQRAYDSAIHMSGKLEAAITRMLLMISNRIEREKIDDSILERDGEAAERAEMEIMRVKMTEDTRDTRPNEIPVVKSAPPVEPVRVIAPKKPIMWQRSYEEPTHEVTQREVLMQQKFMSERQQKALLDMHNLLNVSKILGANVYSNLKERDNAISWAKDLSERIRKGLNSKFQIDKSAKILDHDVSSKNRTISPSKVSSDLAKIDRSQIKLSFCKRSKTRKRKVARIVFGE